MLEIRDLSNNVVGTVTVAEPGGQPAIKIQLKPTAMTVVLEVSREGNDRQPELVDLIGLAEGDHDNKESCDPSCDQKDDCSPADHPLPGWDYGLPPCCPVDSAAPEKQVTINLNFTL